MIQARRVWQSSDAADLDLGADWAEINWANKSDLDLGAEWERELAQMGVVDTGGGTATFEELAAEFLGEDEFSLGVKTGDPRVAEGVKTGEEIVAQGVVPTAKDVENVNFILMDFSKFYEFTKVSILSNFLLMPRYRDILLNNNTIIHVEGYGETTVKTLYESMEKLKEQGVVRQLYERVEKYSKEILTAFSRKNPTPKNFQEFQTIVNETKKELTIIDNQCKKLLEPKLREKPSDTSTPVQNESNHKVIDEGTIEKRLAYFQEKDKHLYGSSGSIVEKLEKELSDFQIQISKLGKKIAGNPNITIVVEYYENAKKELAKLLAEKVPFQEMLKQGLEKMKLESDTGDSITFFESIEKILKELERTENNIDRKVNDIENQLHSVQLYILSLLSIKKYAFLQDVNSVLNLVDLRTQNVCKVNEEMPFKVKTFIDEVNSILEQTAQKIGFFESGVKLHTEIIFPLDEYQGEIGLTKKIIEHCNSMESLQSLANKRFGDVLEDMKSIFSSSNRLSIQYKELQEILDRVEQGLQNLAIYSQKIYLHLKADKFDDIPEPPVFIYAFRDTPSLDALNRIYLEGVGKDVSEESAGAVPMGEATPLSKVQTTALFNEQRLKFLMEFNDFRGEILKHYDRLTMKEQIIKKYTEAILYPTKDEPDKTVSATQLINFFLTNGSEVDVNQIKADVESKFNTMKENKEKLDDFKRLCSQKSTIMKKTLSVLKLLITVENKIEGSAGGAGAAVGGASGGGGAAVGGASGGGGAAAGGASGGGGAAAGGASGGAATAAAPAAAAAGPPAAVAPTAVAPTAVAPAASASGGGGAAPPASASGGGGAASAVVGAAPAAAAAPASGGGPPPAVAGPPPAVAGPPPAVAGPPAAAAGPAGALVPVVTGPSSPTGSVVSSVGSIMGYVSGIWGGKPKPTYSLAMNDAFFDWDKCGNKFRWTPDQLSHWSFDSEKVFEVLHSILQIQWKHLEKTCKSPDFDYDFVSNFVEIFQLGRGDDVNLTHDDFLHPSIDFSQCIIDACILATSLIEMYSASLNLYFASEYQWQQRRIRKTLLDTAVQKNIGKRVSKILHSNYRKIMTIVSNGSGGNFLSPVVLYFLHLLEKYNNVVTQSCAGVYLFFVDYMNAMNNDFFQSSLTFAMFKKNYFSTDHLFSLVITEGDLRAKYDPVIDLLEKYEDNLSKTDLQSRYETLFSKYVLQVNIFSQAVSKTSPNNVDTKLLNTRAFGLGSSYYSDFPEWSENDLINTFLDKRTKAICNAYSKLLNVRKQIDEIMLPINFQIMETEFFFLYFSNLTLCFTLNNWTTLGQIFVNFFTLCEFLFQERIKHKIYIDFQLKVFHLFQFKNFMFEVSQKFQSKIEHEKLCAFYEETMDFLNHFNVKTDTEKINYKRKLKGKLNKDSAFRSEMFDFFNGPQTVDTLQNIIDATENEKKEKQQELLRQQADLTPESLISSFILFFCNDAFQLSKTDIENFLKDVRKYFFVLKFHFNDQMQDIFYLLACILLSSHNKRTGANWTTEKDFYTFRAIAELTEFDKEKSAILSSFGSFSVQRPSADSHDRVKNRLDVVSAFLSGKPAIDDPRVVRMLLDGSHEFNDVDMDETEMSHMLLLQTLLNKIKEMNSTLETNQELHKKAVDTVNKTAEAFLRKTLAEKTAIQHKANSFAKEVQVWQEQIQAQCKGDFLIAQKMREIYGTQQMKMMMAPHETTMRLPAAPKIVL